MKKIFVLLSLILVLGLFLIGCNETKDNLITESKVTETKPQIKDDSLEHCLEIVDYEYNTYKNYTKECVYRKLVENGITDRIICGTIGLHSPALMGLHREECTDERHDLQSRINMECEHEKPKHIKTFIEDEDPTMTDEGKAIEKCLKKYNYPYR